MAVSDPNVSALMSVFAAREASAAVKEEVSQ